MELTLDLRSGRLDLVKTLETLGCKVLGTEKREHFVLHRVGFREGWDLLDTNHNPISVLRDPAGNMRAYVIKEGTCYSISSWL